MFLKLLAFFIIVPLLEIVVLIKIGEIIGVGVTIGTVIITGALGVLLAKHQGFLVMEEFSNSLYYGYMPGNSIIEGILILIGAAVLLTPGFITDIFGFLLLIPVSRRFIRESAKKSLKHYYESGKIAIFIR